MSASAPALRPISACLRCRQFIVGSRSSFAQRAFTSSAIARHPEVDTQTPQPDTPPPPTKSPPPPRPPAGPQGDRPNDPNWVVYSNEERRLIKTTGKFPIGSRRRRAALRMAPNIPFEQLPFQCFQEARKVLAADREEKVKQIEVQRARLQRLRGQDAAISGGEREKQHRIRSMERKIEELKILADINDPVIKKRFEDGLGDLSKPIYRFLADREWRSYKRRILMQRVETMNVVPDALQNFDPEVDVTMTFAREMARNRKPVQPGELIPSRVSERAPRLSIQQFDKGEKLVSIAVVDLDVPDIETDGFDYRCHFLAANIPISPTKPTVHLSGLKEDQVILPWLPPVSEKGIKYHRLSLFVLDQENGQKIAVEAAKKKEHRDSWVLRSFLDRYGVRPIGVNLFRSQWDEGTADVMKKHGIPGWDVQFKRKRVEPLPYKKKNTDRYRGWR